MRKIARYFIAELNTTVFTLDKDTSYEEMRDAIDEYYKGELTKYIVIDFTMLEKHLSSEEVMRIGQQMRIHGRSRKGGFDLVVVPGLLQFGLGRMYAAYVEDIDSNVLQTKVFHSNEAALKWIQENEIAEKNKPSMPPQK